MCSGDCSGGRAALARKECSHRTVHGLETAACDGRVVDIYMIYQYVSDERNHTLSPFCPAAILFITRKLVSFRATAVRTPLLFLSASPIGQHERPIQHDGP